MASKELAAILARRRAKDGTNSAQIQCQSDVNSEAICHGHERIIRGDVPSKGAASLSNSTSHIDKKEPHISDSQDFQVLKNVGGLQGSVVAVTTPHMAKRESNLTNQLVLDIQPEILHYASMHRAPGPAKRRGPTRVHIFEINQEEKLLAVAAPAVAKKESHTGCNDSGSASLYSIKTVDPINAKNNSSRINANTKKEAFTALWEDADDLLMDKNANYSEIEKNTPATITSTTMEKKFEDAVEISIEDVLHSKP